MDYQDGVLGGRSGFYRWGLDLGILNCYEEVLNLRTLPSGFSLIRKEG